MLLPLADLDEELVLKLLRQQYDAEVAGLEFHPVGEDSWSYRADHLWISVRRDFLGHIPAAYEAARNLADAGVAGVLGPLAGRDGTAVHEVQGRPILVFPFVDGTPLPDVPDPDRLAEPVRAVLAGIHSADLPAALPVEDYTLAFGDDLDRSLAAARRPARRRGPYSEAFFTLMRAHLDAVCGDLAELSRAAALCRADPGPLVLTHGEPNAQNFLLSGDDLLLVDWGEAAAGPPERDWFHVLRTLGAAPAECRPVFLRYYQLKWRLSEITEYAVRFLHDHSGDREDAAMWRRLVHYLPATSAVRG